MPISKNISLYEFWKIRQYVILVLIYKGMHIKWLCKSRINSDTYNGIILIMNRPRSLKDREDNHIVSTNYTL